MKAVVFYPKVGFKIEEIAKPEISATQVLLKVHSAGFCASDFGFYKGVFNDEKFKPLIFGHEFAGEIVEVGNAVRGLSIGQRVVATPAVSCGKCHYCLIGKNDRCENCKQVLGFTVNGGFAQYCAIEENGVIPIGDISYDIASFIEPISCCWYATSRAKIIPGETILIIGLGTIGLLELQVAKSIGAKVMVVGKYAKQMEIAKKLGADVILSLPKNGIKELKLPEVPDVIFAAIGKPEVIEYSINNVARGGKIVMFGFCEDEENVKIYPMKLILNDLTLIGSQATPSFLFARSIDMIRKGIINPEPMITHKFGMNEFMKAVDVYKNQKGESIKVIIHPNM
ncbi:MAG: alcohol dehydrogenase catalytic domain-containing protein [Candidatus Firestonebacteria bacterium]